jgi:predicted transposase/invertase (TIGR01784 family)
MAKHENEDILKGESMPFPSAEDTSPIDQRSPDILSLGQDWLFKYVFGNSDNQEILVAFLMSILRIPREEFKQLTYTNTDLLRNSENDKLGILDVRVETVSGHDIDIEIQIADMEGMAERIVYYAGKMLSSHMHAGNQYTSMKKTIVIVIAHFDWFKTEKNYHHRFLLRDEETGYVFSDIIEVNTLELPTIPKAPEQAGDANLWNWAALLAARKEDELNMLAERSPEIGRAVGLIKKLSADEIIRMQYEAREKARLDEQARMSFAVKAAVKAAEEAAEAAAKVAAEEAAKAAETAAKEAVEATSNYEKREFAKKLLRRGTPIEYIAEDTGLSRADIQSLQV